MKLKIDKYRFRGVISEFGQAKLAASLGTKQPNISRMLKNLDRLSFERFNQICEALQADPRKFLLFEEGEREERAAWPSPGGGDQSPNTTERYFY